MYIVGVVTIIILITLVLLRRARYDAVKEYVDARMNYDRMKEIDPENANSELYERKYNEAIALGIKPEKLDAEYEKRRLH